MPCGWAGPGGGWGKGGGRGRRVIQINTVNEEDSKPDSATREEERKQPEEKERFIQSEHFERGGL